MTTSQPGEFEFDYDEIVRAMLESVVKGLGTLNNYPVPIPEPMKQGTIGIASVIANLSTLANTMINRYLLYGKKAQDFTPQEVAKFGMAIGTLIQILYQHAQDLVPVEPIRRVFEDMQDEMRRQVEAAGFDLNNLPGADIGTCPVNNSEKKQKPKVRPSIQGGLTLDANQSNLKPPIPDSIEEMLNLLGNNDPDEDDQ